jgi:hypothetical protein
MKPKVIAELKHKKYISNELQKEINEYGIQTGSWLFGGYGSDSDVDYIIPPEFPHTWAEFKELQEYCYLSSEIDYSGEELNSIYVKTENGGVYNLLFINPKKLNQWIEATTIMYNLTRHHEIKELIKNKDNRVSLFETLKTMIYRKEKEI